MNKILKFIFSRLFIVGFLIVLQISVIVVGVLILQKHFAYFYLSCTVISIGLIFWLLSTKENPSVKLPWAIVILVLPIFGGLLYLLFGHSVLSNKTVKKIKRANGLAEKDYPDDKETIQKIWEENPLIATHFNYIKNVTGMPAYQNTSCKFLNSGEMKFETLKQELKKAKKFIFLEYFIIEEGLMWDSILDILVEKVKEGIEVRVMYDDVGSLQTLPSLYNLKLESMGIKCIVFNPFRPALAISMQNRDHRKIAVIDGNVGFTGGINLADEYINAYKKHGHWKDCSVMLKGDGVYGLTLLFLEMWNSTRPEDNDFSIFKNTISETSDGYIQPYGDSPHDSEYVGENVYLNIINSSYKYLYICSPYFIVDNEVITALTSASKRGVDIRIVTPHIWDKYYVHILTRSFYPQLIRAGIKVYEYTPGFIHSKTFVADDKIATVGTVNLDYRSLYHHYECGVLMYENQACTEIKNDFLSFLPECEEMTYEKSVKAPIHKRLLRGFLRLFAPLM
ncbi:MAG: cardiolipin synthase [Oscillospiraceae bacterium]